MFFLVLFKMNITYVSCKLTEAFLNFDLKLLKLYTEQVIFSKFGCSESWNFAMLNKTSCYYGYNRNTEVVTINNN